MRRVVILGGYGAVGREAAGALAAWFPEVVVAGRSLAKAREVPGAVPLRVDVSDPGDLDRALDGADAVLMCVERDNARVAEACLRRGVHYVDVSASHEVLAAIEKLDAGDATAVLSVGLAPGVTNLLARLHGDGPPVEIGVLIGSGERHGPGAVEWTLDALGELGPSWRMRFPEPFGRRTVHGFPFSDQHTLGAGRVRTGLCLDSRLLTALLTGPVARAVRTPRGRAAALAALTRLHVGADRFAVVVSSGGVSVSFGGRGQSRASGLAAALVVRRLAGMPAGVRHIDEVVEPLPFLRELASFGFAFDTGAGGGGQGGPRAYDAG
ncbi:saccharopine dehydrogenase NADP-binding domain-containing protein [Actinomadura viridis]|uniref:Saccharopine dehydrogenase NADP binding domain-containing protein n=1 Tax=Actinomadura viridis TaxID=58110 RepID=A0A931DSX3_9ACTN|nr:saccharopine dehydrogenase NADP-binding domain-containing protein [Actinomadura viridis]MBG6093342.1 hypothetical protein [Actinomadura viridis]